MIPLVLITLALAPLLVPPALPTGSSTTVMTAAHRGQWRTAPENSFAAVQAAFRDGAEIAEVDVRLTKDRVPVLMHDTTVDRTTNGKGRVDSFTFRQLHTLKLREGLGGPNAKVTNHTVPPLSQVVVEARKQGKYINLDKGWPIRNEMWKVLTDFKAVPNGIFKSNAPVAEVNAFRNTRSGETYMHLVSDNNITHVDQFGSSQPKGYELIFDNINDKVAQPAFIKRLRSTGFIWSNSMTANLSGGNVDNANGWNTLISTYGARVIQTDNVVALETYLKG